MAVEAVQLRHIGPDDHFMPASSRDILQRYEKTAHLGDSASTRKSYLTQARLFIQWLENSSLSIEQVTADTVATWRRHIELREFKPATLALKVVAVRKFLLWAQSTGHVPLLYAEELATRTPNGQKTHLAPPKISQISVQHLDFEEVQALLAAPFAFTKTDGTLRETTLRDASILSLLALRGLRECELAGLTIGSFELCEECGILTVTGKGKKWRQINIDPVMWTLLERYLNSDGRAFSREWRDGSFLHGQRGPMTAQGIIAVVRRHGQRALERDDVTPRMLRKTFAALASRELRDEHGNLVKPAIPPYVLQRVLGHEDLKTTQRYVNAAVQADDASAGTYLGLTPPVPLAGYTEDIEA